MKTSALPQKINQVHPLIDFLDSVQPLSAGAKKILLRDSSQMTVEKKRFILKPGAASQNFYFIVKGVVQGFVKENGRSITTWIMQENEIAGSFRTVGTGEPCNEYVQALEDSQLIVLPVATTEYMFDHYPESNVIARRLWEFKYRQAEERAYLVRISNATKRYNRFIEIYPGLADRISLKYIASHLGMTLETLSRIRSRQQRAAE